MASRELLVLAERLGLVRSLSADNAGAFPHAAGSPSSRRESCRREGSPAAAWRKSASPAARKGSPGAKASTPSPSSSFQMTMSSRFSESSKGWNREFSEQDPPSMAILAAMRGIAHEERESHALELSNESMRLENKFHGGVSQDSLLQRSQSVAVLEAHVARLLAVERSALAHRMQAPFTTAHLAVPPDHHDEVLGVIEHAVDDLARAHKDKAVIGYTHKAKVPLSHLRDGGLRIRNKSERCGEMRSVVMDARDSLADLSRALTRRHQQASFV